jgi:hypothetical protein
MRSLLLVVLTIHITGTNGLAAHYFQSVSISKPREDARLQNGSRAAGTGFLFMPDAEKKEDLQVRVRLYRPIDGDFEVIREVNAEVGPGPRPSTWRYEFHLNLEKPVREGRHVLWVDCFDKSTRRAGLLASASAFVTVAGPTNHQPAAPAEEDRPADEQPIAPPDDRAREYKMICISNPTEGERHSTRANVLGTGYVFLPHVDRMEDIAVRARLYYPTNQGMAIVQEMQAPVTAGLFGQPATYQYTCDLKRNVPLKEGRHLLQVECLDVSEEEPRVLISARRFVPVVELHKK